MNRYIRILVISCLVLCSVGIGSNPRYIEELCVGGGYGDSVNGGADFEKDGQINTDGGVDIGTGKLYKIGGVQINSDALSDTASIGMLDEAETITGDWVNIAHPWDDGDVADQLTIDGSAIGQTTKLTYLQVDEDGLDVDPTGDANADLITVGVTGTPKLSWDEAGDEFDLNKNLTIGGDLTVGGGNIINAGTISIDTSAAALCVNNNFSGLGSFIRSPTNVNLSLFPGATNQILGLMASGTSYVQLNRWGGTGGVKAYNGGSTEIWRFDNSGNLQLDGDLAVDGLQIGATADPNLITLDPNNKVLINGGLQVTGNLCAEGTIYGDGGAEAYGMLRKVVNDVDGKTCSIAETETVQTNAGAGGAGVWNLPEASTAIGMSYTFVVLAIQNMDVNPDNADRILGLTNAVGDAIRSSTHGNTVTLLAVNNSFWVVTGSYGTWTDVN